MTKTAANTGMVRVGLALAGVGAAGVAAAQEAPQVSFGTATATFEDGLGSMRGVRELEDGRVLIADGFGAAVIVWMPGSGADTLTNTGQGPEEYRTPDGLFPLPDGGTLLVDLGNARLTRIEADLSFGETWPIAHGAPNTGMTMMIPVGTDRDGGIYFQRRLDGMTGTSDSAAVARFDPASGEISEAGRVRLAEQTRVESGDANNRSVNIRPVPFSNQDAWNVAWDGRVAIARADGYRLEWMDPAGGVTRGPEIAYEPVRVRRADQDEWIEGLGGGLRVEATDDGGGMRMSMSRAPSGSSAAIPPTSRARREAGDPGRGGRGRWGRPGVGPASCARGRAAPVRCVRRGRAASRPGGTARGSAPRHLRRGKRLPGAKRRIRFRLAREISDARVARDALTGTR